MEGLDGRIHSDTSKTGRPVGLGSNPDNSARSGTDPGASANGSARQSSEERQNRADKEARGEDVCTLGSGRYRQLQESGRRPADSKADRANSGHGFSARRPGLRK